jgi:hypothetical protein
MSTIVSAMIVIGVVAGHFAFLGYLVAVAVSWGPGIVSRRRQLL